MVYPHHRILTIVSGLAILIEYKLERRPSERRDAFPFIYTTVTLYPFLRYSRCIFISEDAMLRKAPPAKLAISFAVLFVESLVLYPMTVTSLPSFLTFFNKGRKSPSPDTRISFSIVGNSSNTFIAIRISESPFLLSCPDSLTTHSVLTESTPLDNQTFEERA